MKEKRVQEITKENMIRIYDEKLLKKLNAFYDKNKALIPYKNKFWVDLIELAVENLNSNLMQKIDKKGTLKARAKRYK